MSTSTPASAGPSVWAEAPMLGPRSRPARTGCPVCARWVRVGYAEGRPVVGQHHSGDVVGHEHAGCCRCPGSYTPVPAEDAVEHTRARALGHPVTGALPAIVVTAIPAPREATS